MYWLTNIVASYAFIDKIIMFSPASIQYDGRHPKTDQKWINIHLPCFDSVSETEAFAASSIHGKYFSVR